MSNLGGITQYQNQLQTGQNLANAGNVPSGVQNGAAAAAADAASAIRQELMQLVKGSMFTGTVTQMKDGNVTVSLDNGQMLHARLDSGVSVMLGQPVLFQVKSNQNNQLMLRQVPVDSAFNPTLQKALVAAGLAVNGRNLGMVNAMMQNQLPIDRGSLLAMARQIQAYPEAGPESLAQMKKLGFPINNTMVQQFMAYKEGNHSLVERFTQMMDQLPQLLSESRGDGSQLLELQKGLLQALEILEEPQGSQAENGAVQEDPAGVGMGPEGQGAAGEQAVAQGQGILSGNQEILSGEQTVAGGQGILSGEQTVTEGQGILSGEQTVAEGQAATGEQAAEIQNGAESQNGRGLPVSEFMGREQLEGLEHQLRQLPRMEENPVLFSGGKLNTAMSAGEMLREIAQQMELHGQAAAGEKAGEKIKSLFSSKGYQSLLKQAMSDQWLLEPRQVEKEKAVEQLYERLNRQMGKLQQLMQQTGRQDMAAARNTTQVRGNLEMMNQINHLYNYVQIPLKLRGQNAHSDLYVYTNKKKLQDRDGELSALLHLELDHLGVTDVRIKMLGSHVTTNFCMADEAALELVEAHLDELTQALSRKGYQCSFETQHRQEEIDFVQDFLEHEAPVGKLMRYSFDVLT